MDDSILPSGKICSDFASGASQWSRIVITLIRINTRPALRAFRETVVTSDLRLAAEFARFGFSVASNHTCLAMTLRLVRSTLLPFTCMLGRAENSRGIC